jgi:intracellular multiplication protein IcmL
MRNATASLTRRLTDPDFQGALVHRSLAVTTALALAVVALAADDVWLRTHPAPPKYFFVDGKHAPRPVAALDSPIVGDTELLEWTVKAALAPYNVNYYDYATQLNTASRRFTPHGWNTFAKSFIDRGNFEELKRARLICHAQSQRAAVVHQTGFQAGALAYEIQVPIVQTCENVNQTSDNRLVLTVQVIRTDDDDHSDGLAIDLLVARPQ